MRLLRIDGINVDIDEQTAIGIDLQSYDVKNVGKPFINVSNTFSIPATSNNLTIFDNPQDPHSISMKVYQTSICDYWIDNEKIIDQAKVRVEDIQDRIILFIYEKKDFWEDIKKDLWPDFVDGLLTWLNVSKNLPVLTDPFTGSANDFLDPYFTATTGVILPYYIGNFGNYISLGQLQREETTLTGTPGLASTTVNTTITSDYVSGSPLLVVTTVSGITTLSIVASTIASDLNNNQAISEYYVASSDGAKLTLTAKEGRLNDGTLNIAISSFQIDNDPTSDNVNPGIPGSDGFLEKTFDPAFGGVSGEIYLKRKTLDEDGLGAHFCIYVRTIFEYIESRYSVDLLTSGGVLNGNIWDDIVAQKLFVPIRELDVFMRNNNCYFKINRTDSFLPLTDQKDKVDRTVYDFIVSFMNHMNVVKDELTIAGSKIIRFARFDDLKLVADVKDFSSNISGTPSFKPRIDGYAQKNIIKFKEVYPEGDSLTNSKTLECLNLNLDINADLIEIDAYVPSVLIANSESISYLADKESFKTFVFYVSDAYTADNINITYYEYSDALYFFPEQRPMQIAKLYDLNSEYNFLDEIIDYPKFYEIKKWLTINDIKDLQFFRQYYIKELGASFFINKIRGFNPYKANEPTTIELIKLGTRTPPPDPDLNYWTDGVSDAWTDGDNQDYWY